VKCPAEFGFDCHLPECKAGVYCWEIEAMNWQPPVMQPKLNPVVRAIAFRHGMTVVLNVMASEPRWEAWAWPARSFSHDPNIAILDCSWKLRNMRKENTT
jgi:hypothetical protein